MRGCRKSPEPLRKMRTRIFLGGEDFEGRGRRPPHMNR